MFVVCSVRQLPLDSDIGDCHEETRYETRSIKVFILLRNIQFIVLCLSHLLIISYIMQNIKFYNIVHITSIWIFFFFFFFYKFILLIRSYLFLPYCIDVGLPRPCPAPLLHPCVHPELANVWRTGPTWRMTVWASWRLSWPRLSTLQRRLTKNMRRYEGKYFYCL